MSAALIWLIVGVVLVGAEVLSGDFVLVMLGAGALGAAAASALGGSPVIGVAVFAVLSLGLIVGARPALKRRMIAPAQSPTNVEALIGASATVESTVDGHGGRVRIRGELWSARALDETQVLEPGRTVMVMEISGATAVVWAEP